MSWIEQQEARWQLELLHRECDELGPRRVDTRTATRLEDLDYELALRALVAELKHQAPAEREQTLGLVDWSDDGRALALFVRALDDPADAVRAEAAWALEQRPLPQWALDDVQRALSDPSPLVRARLRRALDRALTAA